MSCGPIVFSVYFLLISGKIKNVLLYVNKLLYCIVLYCMVLYNGVVHVWSVWDVVPYICILYIYMVYGTV